MIVLAEAGRRPIAEVSKLFRVSVSSIYTWARLFKEQGVAGLQERPKGHAPSKLSGEQLAAIRQWITDRVDHQGRPTHWTYERLRIEILEVFNITIIYMPLRRQVRKMGVVSKRPRPHHVDADPLAQETFKKKLRTR